MSRILLTLLLATSAAPPAVAETPRLRRPVAVVVSPDCKLLYTANRRSGSVSVIDAVKRSVVQEIDLGGRLTALAMPADGRRLLVTDEKNHQLILLSRGGAESGRRKAEGGIRTDVDAASLSSAFRLPPSALEADWTVAARMKVAPYPVHVVACRDGRRCYVSSLWSQSVTVVELPPPGKSTLRPVKVIRLPFLPGTLCLVKRDGRLIVAGRFEGKLGVIDTTRHVIVGVKKIPGHNIRGLAASADGKRLLTTQQTLNPLARSTRDDVHWGNMLVNVLYSLAMDDVCDPKADPLRDGRETHFGAPQSGAGDPGAIAVAKGRVAITLSGVHEVAVSGGLTDPLNRVRVGRRPTAVAMSPDGKRIFVADEFSDSVSIVDPEQPRRIARISLGPRPKPTPADRGEELFFDARLSHDGWMSCHSCHTDGHTNGRLNDNLSDGSFGAPKRVLSLLGVADTGPWAWNGTVGSLERQVTNSITGTMQGKRPTGDQVADLVAYLKTLKPPLPPYRFDDRPDAAALEGSAAANASSAAAPDGSAAANASSAAALDGSAAANASSAAAIKSGRRLFESLNCSRCHSPPTYTSKGTYDVGLKDAVGVKRFNPPSLRGVGWRNALFHDGRARSLHDVLARYKHQLPRALSKRERDELIAFLRSL